MEIIISWILSNWILVLALVVELVISIFNGISEYWENCSGFKKVALMITEAFSIFTSAGARFGWFGKLKLPLLSIKPKDPKKE